MQLIPRGEIHMFTPQPDSRVGKGRTGVNVRPRRSPTFTRSSRGRRGPSHRQPRILQARARTSDKAPGGRRHSIGSSFTFTKASPVAIEAPTAIEFLMASRRVHFIIFSPIVPLIFYSPLVQKQDPKRDETYHLPAIYFWPGPRYPQQKDSRG